jgi:hypothetical protein
MSNSSEWVRRIVMMRKEREAQRNRDLRRLEDISTAAEVFFTSLGPAIEDVLRTYNEAFGTRILSCLQDADEYIIAEQSADGVRSKCKIKLLPFDSKTPDIPARLAINRTVKGKSVPDESQTLEFDQNSRGDIEVQRLGCERDAVVQEILKPWLESL